MQTIIGVCKFNDPASFVHWQADRIINRIGVENACKLFKENCRIMMRGSPTQLLEGGKQFMHRKRFNGVKLQLIYQSMTKLRVCQ